MVTISLSRRTYISMLFLLPQRTLSRRTCICRRTAYTKNILRPRFGWESCSRKTESLSWFLLLRGLIFKPNRFFVGYG
ncbi:hypothetical protein HanXRQr2_Chr13g0616391 [Helianthus annuus]|uniref:Uncharacterized protein n=1 Tax=Helianthus annuus TaxID=4232 RepID=A0A9K3HCJ3_HELAN|nr:hypothetical protein HanXRQr2_Chr13g0616391 [Helianthus annuus]